MAATLYKTTTLETYPGNIAGFETSTTTYGPVESVTVGFTKDSVIYISGEIDPWGKAFEGLIPGYKNKEQSYQDYFLNNKKQCTLYNYENGWFEFVPSGPWSFDGVFHPSARRKVNFYYDDNSEALALAFGKIDITEFSPYTSIIDRYTGKAFNIAIARIYFENISSTYTDSVFKFDYNDVKTLQYAKRYTHTVTKDTKKRITSW